ncbi:MAG TPA: HAD-IIB family hydrolase [Burkholderiales bacterium]|nr:HAD-IIB family hydrolase [Burkholderiales bacterium]
MRPLAEFSLEARRRIRAVLTDIDDTLTSAGRLTAQAYLAMERLHDAGLLVIPVTGRPAGWCDHIARMWPVDGVVGENGAFYFRYDSAARRMIRRYASDERERAADRARLAALRDRILREVPGSALAADQPYREADLAIDFCEDVPRLPEAAIDRIVALMQAEGLTAKVSSIHVNGWFGRYDKASTARLMLAECFGIDLDAERERLVFVGDSPNDQPLFALFPNAVGVANVADFAARLTTRPAYVTEARAGAGFAELAQALLAARGTG